MSRLITTATLLTGLGLATVFIPVAAAPAPTGIPAGSVFGPSPIYSPGIKPSMVVDEFGPIDSELSTSRRQEITRAIAAWKAEGISYGAYFDMTRIESGIKYSLSSGARIDLDGSSATQSDAGGTYYEFSITRSSFKNYLIDSGKLAIDLGAEHIFLDVGSVDYSQASFDAEIIAAFATHIGNPTFDIRSHLTGLGYATTNDIATAVGNADVTLVSDSYWQQWVAYDKVIEREFFSAWTSALKSYASSLGKTVYLSANRYISDADNFIAADLFDYTLAETFLDTLNYPYQNLSYAYKSAVAFGKRFWSWNAPANTATLNGTGDPYATVAVGNLDKQFIAEAYANGGISQVMGAGWSHYHNYGFTPAAVAPYYALVTGHSDLFNHPEAGEIAILYTEAGIATDPGGVGGSFKGISMMLSQAQRVWDVVFAADTSRRDGSETMTLAQLNNYNALVLPGTSMLSDAQITILENYLNNGGTVIGMGSIATHDETGVDVSATRTFDNHFGVDNVDTTTYTGTLISIQSDLGAAANTNLLASSAITTQVSAFKTAIDSSVAPEITTTLPATVHLTRFEVSADGSHIYHLVNTNFNLVSNTTTPVAAGETLTLPVPPNYAGTINIDIVSPEAAVATLTSTGTGATRTVTLPTLNVWAIIKVGSAMPTNTSLDHKPWSQIHLVDNAAASIDDSTATGGYRPDTLNITGDIEWDNWYWKGGSHDTVPFNIPFFASDDIGLGSITLFYRHSTDKVSWSSWAAYQTLDVSAAGSTSIDVFSFNAPLGEGHYQFYTQASDSAGQLESVVAGDKTGYGVDSTPPEPPASFVAAGGVSTGYWQNSVDTPVFSWTSAIDNLSGASQNIHLSLRNSLGTTVANCVLLGGETQWNTATECSPGDTVIVPGSLANGRYEVFFRTQDKSGNWSDHYPVFSFMYGTNTLSDVVNPVIEVGDGQLKISWTAPTVINYTHVQIYKKSASDNVSEWINPYLTPDATTNCYIISGLTNGVSYDLMLESAGTGVTGNRVELASSYTPTVSGGVLSCTSASTEPAPVTDPPADQTDQTSGNLIEAPLDESTSETTPTDPIQQEPSPLDTTTTDTSTKTKKGAVNIFILALLWLLTICVRGCGKRRTSLPCS
ncbi:MAG: hypothetical protein OEZ43_05790 [Gammaproteobacteria bacterium]|nr:hypothetical protein [Gammaproteobacteria bacterium]